MSKCNSVKIDMKVTVLNKSKNKLNHFPSAKVDRMDWDTRGKYSVDKIFEKFENHQIDILIGTQMVTKGLDLKILVSWGYKCR